MDPAVQHHVVAALASEASAREGSDSHRGAASILPDDLTPRETEVLALIAEGLANTVTHTDRSGIARPPR